jgi:hypothetical protein
MGKFIGNVAIFALFIILVIAPIISPTHVSVSGAYPPLSDTPTPTNPVGSCTGWADCYVEPGQCGCGGSLCNSNAKTYCRGPSGGAYSLCSSGCSSNTACPGCSTPPAGCPDPPTGCTWNGANDCGGGVCGCGARRTGTLWCGSLHCEDICTSDQSCTAGCNQPTPTSTPPPSCPECGTYPNCYSPSCTCTCGCSSLSCSGQTCNPNPYCSPVHTCDCYSNSCTGGVGKPEPYCSDSCQYNCVSIDCYGGVCNPTPPVDCTNIGCGIPPNCFPPYCDPSHTCGCYSTSCTGGADRPEPYCDNTKCPGGCSSDSCDGGVCIAPPISPPISPTPIPPCGDGLCDSGETCSNCSLDCGVCTGTVRARACLVLAGDSCNTVRVCSTPLTPTILSATGTTSLSPKTQTDGNYVSWLNTQAGTYTIAGNAPSGYVLRDACWERSSTVPTTGMNRTSSFAESGETLSWDLGYTVPGPWLQTGGGGDVYASGTLQTYVPAGTTPRLFSLTGSGGSPGIVTYGSSYDFDSDVSEPGDSFVSETGWLVNETYAPTDYYQVFYHRFGSPTPTATGDTTISTQLDSSADPYYYNGNVTVSGGAWNISNGASVVVLVSGNLTINTPITITPGGFVAFIVNGNITNPRSSPPSSSPPAAPPKPPPTAPIAPMPRPVRAPGRGRLPVASSGSCLPGSRQT